MGIAAVTAQQSVESGVQDGQPLVAVITDLRSPDSPRETAYRIEMSPAALPEKTATSSNAEHGFKISIKGLKKMYRTGERITPTVEITNLGPRSSMFTPIEHYSLVMPGFISCGYIAEVTVTQLAGERPQDFAFLPGLPRGHRKMSDPIELTAGDSREYEIRGIRLGPGEYEIQVTYYAWSEGLIPDAEDDLKTHVHGFQIEE